MSPRGGRKKGRSRASHGRPGLVRQLARFLWGLVMTAILALFGLSVSYRLQEPDADLSGSVPVILPSSSAATVVVLNGSATSGLARDFRDVIMKDRRFDVVDVDNADDTSYNETLVVDVGGREAAAGDLTDYIRHTTGVGRLLHHRVANPTADVLVILGADAAGLVLP